MSEVEWVKTFAPTVEARLRVIDRRLSVLTGRKLPYANEIRSYKNAEIDDSDFMVYETDLLVTESAEDGIWKPRVIVEVKCRGSITTHDAWRKAVGLDVTLEAARAYLKRPDSSPSVLMKYARVCGVEKLVTPYLEAMTT